MKKIKPPEPQPENLTGNDFLTDDDAAWHMARWEPGGEQYEKQQPMPGEAA